MQLAADLVHALLALGRQQPDEGLELDLLLGELGCLAALEAREVQHVVHKSP